MLLSATYSQSFDITCTAMFETNCLCNLLWKCWLYLARMNSYKIWVQSYILGLNAFKSVKSVLRYSLTHVEVLKGNAWVRCFIYSTKKSDNSLVLFALFYGLLFAWLRSSWSVAHNFTHIPSTVNSQMNICTYFNYWVELELPVSHF